MLSLGLKPKAESLTAQNDLTQSSGLKLSLLIHRLYLKHCKSLIVRSRTLNKFCKLDFIFVKLTTAFFCSVNLTTVCVYLMKLRYFCMLFHFISKEMFGGTSVRKDKTADEKHHQRRKNNTFSRNCGEYFWSN